jgi:TetR/AcrR family tetracycline transcriptional repressor
MVAWTKATRGGARTTRARPSSPEMPRPAPARRLGRPARLSRESILDAAVALLDRAPREPLTVARIATEVDAVPAALYRHFASVDDLQDGVLGRVLGGVDLESRRRARWPARIRDWMTALRSQLLRYPTVLTLIGRRGRTSPAWLDVAAAQIRILEDASLRGARLARAHLWVTETTIGIVMQEASLSLPDQIRGARASLSEMSEPGRARLAPLMPHLAALDADDLFEFVVDRTIAALAELVATGDDRL